MKMNLISTAERPRERLQTLGPEVLSLTELVAIVIGTGSNGRGAYEVANDLLNELGSVRSLAVASVEKLAKVKGVGLAKACRLRAAIELGKRVLKAGRGERTVIRCPEDVADLVMDDMKHLDREHFRVLLLDSKNAVISIETVSIGTVDASLVHPREVLKPALEKSASAIVLVHNHPTGCVKPSREDIQLTKRFARCCEIIGIDMLDHIIVGDGYRSLREAGYL